MTQLIPALVAAATLIALVYVIVRYVRPLSGDAPAAAQLTEELAHQVRILSERVSADTMHLTQRLEGIDARMTSTQVASQDMARDIFGRLGEVQRATQTVAEQAKQFSSLQDLLRAPKARGGLGEALLEELLGQVLPPQAFAMQHRFASGVVVDAVVRAGGRKVCIDSKFPLDNYQRMCEATDDVERRQAERSFAADVESHIRAIAARYIVPDEDTLDFAVMYVPAEGLYAEVLRLQHRKRSLFDVAIESRVVPMSPLTMYSYLQTILYGLKCLKIEENARAILDDCGRLQTDLERFANEYDTLGRHLAHAHAKYGDAQRNLDRFRMRLDQVIEVGDEEEDPRPSLEAVAGE